MGYVIKKGTGGGGGGDANAANQATQITIATNAEAAQATAADPASFGIVLGGSGNGEQMAANKVKGVRAALVWSIETAKLAREHNNANVISIGGRMHDEQFCLELVDTFLATPFTGDERHVRRIGQISKFESDGKI
jgi:ribose 5-phosphate isomerase B